MNFFGIKNEQMKKDGDVFGRLLNVTVQVCLKGTLCNGQVRV
jgi:hypothetical protein